MMRIGRNSALVLCALLAFGALPGCRATSPLPKESPHSLDDHSNRAQSDLAAIDLLPANRLRGNFVLHQVITVRWAVQGEEFEESFNAALQRNGETLLVLGLGPLGQVGFELRLEEGNVYFENRIGRVLPFAPEHILADVQRVFYPWIEGTDQCTDCQRKGTHQAISIVETYSEGALTERRFSRQDDLERGYVVIEYGQDRLAREIPARANLRNDWVGYALDIKTHRLDPIP